MHKKIVVVKIGSGVLFTQRGKLDEFRITSLARQIALLSKSGAGIVLVVSGAVACGVKSVVASGDTHFVKTLAAGVGQAVLTSAFERIFSACGICIAQLLVTKKDLTKSKEMKKLATTIEAYVRINVVPMINENDVIALNDFSGNDFLAVEIAHVLAASQLVILSTMKGSKFGVGGGVAKRAALQMAQKKGIESLIVDGKSKDILLQVI